MKRPNQAACIRCAILLLCSWLMNSAFASVTRYTTVKWVDVEIDDAGRIGQLNWPNGDLGTHTTRVEHYLEQFSIHAIQTAASPIAGATSLRLDFVVERRGQKFQRLILAAVQTSPRIMRFEPPNYPLAELHRGRQAHLQLQADFDEHARLTQFFSLGETEVPKPFLQAAAKTVRNWEFRPERLDGKSLAGSMIFPMGFSIGKGMRRPPELILNRRTTLPLQPLIGPIEPAISAFRLVVADQPALMIEL